MSLLDSIKKGLMGEGDEYEDQDITEIMINGPDHIFIEKGGRLLDSGKKFPSQAKLEDVIQQIV